MNDAALLLKGMIIGFSIAAPVGPIGILCINRTLASGMLAGLFSGLGAAFADAFYGCVAGFGLVSISGFLISQKFAIHLVGGSFLLYLGVKTFIRHSNTKPITDHARTLFRDFTSTFLLTITNPATIISFVAIYASLSIIDTKANYIEAMLIVAGVFAGSLLWWTILSLGVTAVKHKLSDKTVHWINIFSGIVLCGFGLFAIINIFLK